MAELKDFMEKQTASLSDFVSEVSTNPMWSRPSAQNFAAHASLMSDTPVETYDRVMDEMMVSGTSRVHQTYLDQLDAESESQMQRAMEGILLDSPEEQVDRLVEGYLNMPQQTQQETLERKAIVAPIKNETQSSERFRVDTGDLLSIINKRRSVVQDMLNEELASTDQGILGIAKDMAEMLVPVLPNVASVDVLEELEDGEISRLASFVGNGEARKKLSEAMSKMPEADRLVFAQHLIEVINTHPGITLSDENKLEKANILRTALEEGYYTNFDRWFDNVVGVLDATGVGAIISRPLRLGSVAKTGFSAIKQMVKRDAVKSPVSPQSASQALKDTNPEKYRELHSAVMLDESGEIAEAAYGASRVDSIGHDIASEVLQPFDMVKNKVDIPVMAPKIGKPDPRVMDVATANGTVYLKEAEKAGVTARVVNDFRAATGLQPRTAMTREGTVVDGVTGEFSNNTVNIRAVYGSMDGGFSSVEEAVNRTKTSLRHYGVDERDIEIMVRDGEHFTPIPASLAPRDLDNFLVQVKFPYRVLADDIPLQEFSTKFNIFDRLSLLTSEKHGGLQRHLLAPSSMLQSELSLGAMRSVDRGSLVAKEMLELSSKFTDVYEKLPVGRRAAVFEEIKRANFEGRSYNKARLIGEGFQQEELVALDRFKEFWDTAYHLENADKRHTLANKGFQVVSHPNGTKLFAKPLPKNTNASRVYDLESDSVITLSKKEIDELYENGGHLSRMEDVMKVSDDVVGGQDGLPVLVKNKAEGTTSRGFRDWDEVLDYREGYFAVKYDSPYFIVKEEVLADGTKYERAVATSGDFKSASGRAEELAKEGGSYRVRTNVKGEERERFEGSVNLSGGRSSQRVRGERLEDATDVNTSGFDMQYVMNPVDSMVGTARGISDRVAMREFMEVGKKRFLQQFEHLLPTNKFGQTLWPSRMDQIGRAGELPTKELADARTTWEAINYWENGYINAIDDGWKAAFRKMGEYAGLRGATKAEKVALWTADQVGPTTAGRRAAFNLMLVLNPARQVIVQGHQAIQLAALRPQYVATRLSTDFKALLEARMTDGASTGSKAFHKATGRTEQQYKDMYQAYMDSGLSAAIDRQSLVRGSMLSAADDLAYKAHARGALKKAGRGVSSSINAARRIGFDVGEEVNMMTSFLTFYDKTLSANKGAKLSVEQLDDVVARARDFTYGMNFADDLPYNQNWLSMVFQFAQVPHKAMLQQTFNRNLTVPEKARMAAFNATMYGVPPGALLYEQVEPIADKLPEDLKEVVIYGIESYALNTAMTAMLGDEVKLHYNALQAVDSAQLVELITNMMTMDALGVIENTPSGSLIFGNNPRLREWGRTVLKFTNFMEEDYEDPTTLPDTIKATLSLSSGFSNAFKARAAYKLGYKQNMYGRKTKDGVNLYEAIGTALGFQTQEEIRNNYIANEMYEQSKAFEEDVREQYRLTKMQMHRVGKDITDVDSALGAINWAWASMEGVRAKEIWEGLVRADMNNGDHTMTQRLLEYEYGGIVAPAKLRQLVRTMPEGEGKDNLTKLLDDMDSIKGD